ncbi:MULTISPECIES: hypothetical protein [Vibrio]|uniref:Uncharacterized protein n=1 Tax=Vibrio cincinnatiensis DSM 19608 TaxID=1123491 RepID=A0A1T4SFI3_VIBCI|nr:MULTISPECIES: hypothetical protein [Vibrio]MDA5312294.1 hypothetical protein [Vibrio cholerae]SKA26591.1 hypothetical protein SAMN02745782_03232 [Vibrio cincinnatiensis DSM 19608]SUP05912.1 Uncharacterised protein [Vibrio cincinnatiensis]
MNKQELVNKLNAISERFSAEMQDTRQKKEKLARYTAQVPDINLSLSKTKGEIRAELDLERLKALKLKLNEQEQERDELTAIIANLTNYTSDKSYTERLDVIRKEYNETEKDLYQYIMEDCSQQIDDLVKKHPELLPLIRDFVVASALVRNATPIYHYGAPFLHLYGYFMDKDWEEHKGIIRQNLGVAELQSW